MDHDQAAGLHTPRFRPRHIPSVRIRDVDRPVETALRVLRIEHVASFGRSFIAVAFLVTLGMRAEDDSEGLDDLSTLHQVQARLRLPDHDEIRLRSGQSRQRQNMDDPLCLLLFPLVVTMKSKPPSVNGGV